VAYAHYAIGGTDVLEDERVFVDMLADAVTEPQLETDATVFHDFDSMLGTSLDFPFTTGGIIMPVLDEKLVLRKSIHLFQQLESDDQDMTEVCVPSPCMCRRLTDRFAQVYQQAMHKIPNIPFLEIEPRHITRIMLPHCRLRDDKDRSVPKEILANVWDLIRPIIVAAQASEDSYLPATFNMERIRQNYTGNSGRALNSNTIATIGPLIIAALRELPFGRQAFFLHQWRGTRGETVHQLMDDAPVASLAGFTSCLDREKIYVDDWAVDMGMTIQIPGKVLLWRRDGLPKAVEELYQVDPDSAQRIVHSTRFVHDEEAQLDAIAGFRHEPDATTRDATGIIYAQLYHSKEQTYNFPELTYKQISQDAGGKYISELEAIYEGARDMPGSARSETRVSLRDVGRRMIRLQALVHLLVAVPADVWW
jgi:hypothetical protein